MTNVTAEYEYDYSNESAEEDEYAREYWNLQLRIIAWRYYVYFVTLIVGLIGNIVAVVVILCSKSFHNLTGYYLLSLSTADLLTLTLAVPNYIFKIEFLSSGKLAQRVLEWVCQMSVMASTCTVTVFTLERYLAICHPFYVQSLSKGSRAKQIIAAIWSISALLALVPTAMLIVQQSGDEEMRRINESLSPYVADVWSALCFFVPIASIVTMYALIWLRLRAGSSGQEPITRQQTNRADARMLMMFVIIVVAFLVSWAPYYIYKVLYAHMVVAKLRTAEFDEHFRGLIDDFWLANLIKQILYPLSSAMNPIIFSLMSKKFRDALRDLVLISSRSVSDWSSKLTGKKNNPTVPETTVQGSA